VNYIALPEKRALLIDPMVIKHVQPSNFPKRGVVTWKGKRWAMVPLDEHSCSVLKKYGCEPPAPIEMYYNWSGRYEPFDHQRETAKFFSLHERCFCFNGLGSGKSLAALWAMDYLMQRGICKKCIIVAPLSTLNRVWADELFNHFLHRSYSVVYGTKGRRQKALDENVDFYIINHDGLKVLHQDLKVRTDITHWIVDELAVFRNKKTDKWKVLNELCGPKTNKSFWGMTGAPMPNGPTDVWAQALLVNPNLVPKYFSRYRDELMTQITQFKWVPKPGWEKKVYAQLKPSIRFRTDDCIDLPPITTQTREVVMSAEQKKAYDKLVKDCLVDLEEGQVVALNEGVKLNKLLQAATGVVYTSEGATAVLDPKPKIAELIEVVEETNKKCIIFTPFKHSLAMLNKVLSSKFTVGVVSGDTAKGRRDEIFYEFQHQELQIILAHPQCMAHGLTLTASANIIWYAPIDNYEIYEQANGRIRRAGQTQHQNIIHLQCSKVEQQVYQRLQRKEKMQGLLLDLLKST